MKAHLQDSASFLKMASMKGIQFGKPLVQEDVTFLNGVLYEDPDWSIFRIRRQENQIFLTMKYKASNRSRDNHELETIVADEQQIRKMLQRLGYTEDVCIKKIRHTASYNGIELCLDEVEELGTFVEAEALTEEDADVDLIQADLWKLLKSLGVGEADRVHKGYDTLVKEHRKPTK